MLCSTFASVFVTSFVPSLCFAALLCSSKLVCSDRNHGVVSFSCTQDWC